jgi:hypothetical protein
VRKFVNTAGIIYQDLSPVIIFEGSTNNMKYLFKKDRLIIWGELISVLTLFVVYFTNLDNAAFQDSLLTFAFRLIGVSTLAFLMLIRVRNLRRMPPNSALVQVATLAYVFALIMFLVACLFDPMFIKVRVYFATHQKEFEQLVTTADNRGCDPSPESSYCAEFAKVPFELLYWTGRDEMFVVKDAGKLYIFLGQKDSGGLVYMSDQDQIPSSIGIAYFSVSCSAKITDKWFMCNAST